MTVSGVASCAADDADDTGFAVQLGAPATDPVWTVTGGSTADRTEQLRLVNPGSEPATVDVTIWNGSTASQPAELTGVEVPAGALVALPLDDAARRRSSWAATVRATDGAVVVGQVGRGDPSGALHLVAGDGRAVGVVADRAPTPRSVRSAPGTTQRLGTELGIQPVDPLPRGAGARPEASEPETRPEAETDRGAGGDAEEPAADAEPAADG